MVEDLEGVRTSIAAVVKTKEKTAEKVLMVRRSLDQLSYKLKIIPSVNDKKPVRKKEPRETIKQDVENVEDDGLKILSVVTSKIQLLLMTASQIPTLTDDKKDSSEEHYEKLVFDTSSIVNPTPLYDIAGEYFFKLVFMINSTIGGHYIR